MNLPETETFLLRFDGSCNPNPGPMGIGYTLSKAHHPAEEGGQGSVNNTRPANLVTVGAQVGEGTNNIAEYHALIAGLRHAIRLGMWRLKIESDSMLVVRQIEGQWKVRDSYLKRLAGEAKALLTLLAYWEIKHIRREENAEADKLSREAAWVEPTLPPTDKVKGTHRALHSFQAAFVRQHWEAGIRNSYFMARIYDVAPTQIEAIGTGQAYKDASFAAAPHYPDGLTPALSPSALVE